MSIRCISNRGFRRLFALLDPWRNIEYDIKAALEHMSVVFSLDQLDMSLFDIEQIPDYAYKPLYEKITHNWDEGWGFGEFLNLTEEERREELRSFRGEDWAETIEYLEDGFPSIVIIRGFPEEHSNWLEEEEKEQAEFYEDIGDGQGRCVVAYALGVESLPATVLTSKNPYEGDDEDEYEEDSY